MVQEDKGFSLSSPVDILVVGGGPAGTAAAFRAHELGLSVLVVERDIMLSKLQEWAERSKRVDASYADGNGLEFPTSGIGLLEELRFDDDSPAEGLRARWLTVFEKHAIPYRENTELVGLKASANGALEATCVDRSNNQLSLFARTAVLALGRPSPPQLQIMGSTTGIQYTMRSPNDFLNAPVCVVGGGMSAAEAVVAIAKAKAAANDISDVFWSYRGRTLSKVAKGLALAPSFYQAWTLGNIRYLPL